MATAVSVPTMDPNVARFVSRTHKNLINGRWVESASGESFATFNPATGDVLSNVAAGNSVDIDRAVKAARTAFEEGPWSRMTASERTKLIWRLADLLEKNLEEFAQLESLDNGKPLAVARAADVPLAIENFRYMAGWATKIEGNTIPLS
ncbi:MAG: aldehyde dehydrogenase family protein, partial [Candidatus Acidiferrales bacterium]